MEPNNVVPQGANESFIGLGEQPAARTRVGIEVEQEPDDAEIEGDEEDLDEMEEVEDVAQPSRRFTEEYVSELQAGYAVTSPERAPFAWKKTQRPRRLYSVGRDGRRPPMPLDKQMVIYHAYLRWFEPDMTDRVKRTHQYAKEQSYIDPREHYDQSARTYIRGIIRRMAKRYNHESDTSKYAVRNNGDRSRYPQLEKMLHSFLSWVNDKVPVTMALVFQISSIMLYERLGKPWAESYKFEDNDVPGFEWHHNLVKHVGFRYRRRSGERALVDERKALHQLPDFWDISRKFTPDRIFNADQTSCEMKEDVVTRWLAKADIGKSKKKCSETFTLMLCVNATGTFKIQPWFFMSSLFPNWLSSVQDWWNPRPNTEAFVTQKVKESAVNELAVWQDALKRKKHAENERNRLTEALANLDESDEDGKARAVLLKTELTAAFQEFRVAEKDRKEAYTAYQNAKAQTREHYETQPYQSTAFDGVPADPGTTDEHVIFTRDLKLPIVKEQSAAAKECADLIHKVQQKTPSGLIPKAELKKMLTSDLHRRSSDDDDMPMLTGPNNLLNARAVKQMKGYMDTRVMCMWLRHFVKETGCTAQNPVLLVLDNVKFHHFACKIAKSWGGDFDGLNVAFLPPASTPYTQPLDIGVMRPLKLGAKVLERRYLSSTTNDDGSQGHVSQLHRINFLVRSWENINPATIADAFAKSPAFHGNPYMTPHPRVVEQMAKNAEENNKPALWLKYVDQAIPARRRPVVNVTHSTIDPSESQVSSEASIIDVDASNSTVDPSESQVSSEASIIDVDEESARQEDEVEEEAIQEEALQEDAEYGIQEVTDFSRERGARHAVQPVDATARASGSEPLHQGEVLDAEITDVREDPAFKAKQRMYLLDKARSMDISMLYPGGQSSLDRQLAEKQARMADTEVQEKMKRRAETERARVVILKENEKKHKRNLAMVYLSEGKPDRHGTVRFSKDIIRLAAELENQQVVAQQPPSPINLPPVAVPETPIRLPAVQELQLPASQDRDLPTLRDLHLIDRQPVLEHREESPESPVTSSSLWQSPERYPTPEHHRPRGLEHDTPEHDTSTDSTLDDSCFGDISTSTALVQQSVDVPNCTSQRVSFILGDPIDSSHRLSAFSSSQVSSIVFEDPSRFVDNLTLQSFSDESFTDVTNEELCSQEPQTSTPLRSVDFNNAGRPGVINPFPRNPQMAAPADDVCDTGKKSRRRPKRKQGEIVFLEHDPTISNYANKIRRSEAARRNMGC